MITPPLILIGAIIVIALVFDFTNGFHDSANSISTVVSTKVLSPRNAVVFAAFFNFLAAFGFGVHCSGYDCQHRKPRRGRRHHHSVHRPCSPSWGHRLEPDHLVLWPAHVIVPCAYRGPCRAGISAAGIAVIKWSTLGQVTLFMVLSPLIGLICGFLFMAAILWLTRKSNKPTTEGYFKRLRLCSAAAYSFSHGTNDAQKTMGIIVPLLFSIGYYGASADASHLSVPYWVIIICYTTIALGTLCGGWRIVKTMG